MTIEKMLQSLHDMAEHTAALSAKPKSVKSKATKNR